MKKVYLNFTFRFFFSYLFMSLLLNAPLSLSAQVYSGNLNLDSQAAVDAFNYTEISGFLSISGADINNLDGLSSLTSVGSLFINYNPALTNLNGLSSLTTVGRTLEIVDNPLLRNLDGLSSLISLSEELFPILGIGTSLGIYSNPLLTNLDGLSGISSVSEFSEVWIVNNSALTEFCGLYTILSNDLAGFVVGGNASNPDKQQILAGGPCILNAVQIIADLLANGSLNQGQANVLSSNLSSCNLNIYNTVVNAWVNASFLTQGQANVLIASASENCTSASRLAAQQTFTLGQNYPNSTRTNIVNPFTLGQNYPNPVSTNTKIPFTLETSGQVLIQIYSTSGKMIKNLMDQYLTEGIHEVEVNLQSVPAGTYLYKIQVGEHIETLPMVVE